MSEEHRKEDKSGRKDREKTPEAAVDVPEVITSRKDTEKALERFKDKTETMKLKDAESEDVQNLLSLYPEEVRNSLTASKYDVERLKDILNNIAVDMNVPMICKGHKCPQAAVCPLSELAAPIGRPCPIERIILRKDMEDYKDALDIDELNRIEMDRIRELSEADVIDRRASADIATNGYAQLNIVGVTEDGKPVYKREKSVAIDIKGFYKKKKDTIIREFLATRESKAKAGFKNHLDPSRYAADLLKKGRITDAEFESEDPKEGDK